MSGNSETSRPFLYLMIFICMLNSCSNSDTLARIGKGLERIEQKQECKP